MKVNLLSANWNKRHLFSLKISILPTEQKTKSDTAWVEEKWFIDVFLSKI